ncbi:sensor histidine kinase [Pseudonocardia petroleophila]|uniref:histidine kinase n=1 Tax=Pseudonocardia petroleophila TaxID=37331 RepID=A0A7G7MJ69_9PSEU|nr:ATP-binding protein [Pseudonocardia petroleophila]QNG52830.1 GHKL domain-containing protein [Pseudonocardia petroleophila]
MTLLRRVSRWSLAAQLFALQALLVALVLGGVGVATYLQFAGDNERETAEEMLGVAHTLAAVPDVLAALDDPDPSAVLQPLTERVRADTATDFVVVMTPTGIRYSHTDPAEIGRTFRGTIGPAAAGVTTFTETYTGTLGPSVRAVVPVVDPADGRVVALVSVGRTVTAVSRELAGRLPVLLAFAGAALTAAALGSWLVSRWLRRTTHDMGPAELSRMYEYYDTVLHSVREGLLLLDRGGRVQLVNDEARRLLALPPEVAGRPVDALGLPDALGSALAAGERRSDEIHLTAERIVVVNQAPARWAGHDLGTVVTLRDHTELRALSTELETIRGFAQSLNAQAHEAANQLHTVVSLIELGRAEEALTYATAELELARHLTDAVLAGIAVPELAALVVGKAAEAGERGVELGLGEGAQVPAGLADPRDLVTIVGNLLDNAVDAALEGPEPRWVRLDAGCADDGFVLRVTDSGPGLPDPEAAFTSGWSTKPADGMGRGLGLALVRRAVHRHGGTVSAGNAPGGGAELRVRLPEPRP